ncbi:MAG TPA: DUF6559 family protein [Candidatus Dormibacteraeota bacterium]|nr:DUF6559 family protein [Candidatus Dormibacteraeota bacterium]
MRVRTINNAAVLLGIVIAGVGALEVLAPQNMVVFHAGEAGRPEYMERITPDRMQFYGILSIVVGLVLAGYAASPIRREAAAIEDYVWQTSRDLQQRFGESPYYTIDQVNRSAERGKFSRKYIVYAHAMFADREQFNSHYHATAFSYDKLRGVVARRYLDGARDFNAAALIRMSRGLYEDHTSCEVSSS